MGIGFEGDMLLGLVETSPADQYSTFPRQASSSSMKTHQIISFVAGVFSTLVSMPSPRFFLAMALSCLPMAAQAAVAPTITLPPKTQVATEGQRVEFTVLAAGSDTLHYVWKRDGEEVGSDSATLTLASVQATDQGEYLVSISNSAGAVTSVPAFLYTEPSATAYFSSRLDTLSAATLTANNWTPVKIPGFRQQVMDAQLNGVGHVWQNIAPGFGNVIYDLKVDDGVITLILDLGGLVQSMDGGKTWKTVSYQLPGNGNYTGFYSFDISPANPQLIITAGLYLSRTTSGGKWWMELHEQALPAINLAKTAGVELGYRTAFGRVRFNSDGSRVFTALGALGHDLEPRDGLEDEMKAMFGRKYIYIGDASGENFKAYDLGTFAGIRSVCPHPTDPNCVYFSYADGEMYVTRNALANTPTFQKLQIPASYQVTSIDVSPWGDGNLLLVLKPLTTGLSQKLVLAKDSGGTVLSCTDVALVNAAGTVLNSSYAVPYSGKWNPRVKDQVFVGVLGSPYVLASDDNTKTFRKITFPSSSVHGLSGFYSSPQWLAFDRKTNLMAAWSCIGGWYSTDQFATWNDMLMTYDDGTKLFGNKGVGYAECAVNLFNLKDAAYMATNDHGLFRSAGADHTKWQCISANPGMPVTSTGAAWASLFFPMGVSPDERFIYAFARGAYPNNPYSNNQLKLVKSIDQGQSWSDVTALLGLGDTLSLTGSPKRFLFNTDASVQLIMFDKSLYVSRDSGATFSLATVPLGAGDALFGFGFTELAYDALHNIFYAAANTGLARSLDSGATWQVINAMYMPGIGVTGKGDLVVGAYGQLFVVPYDKIGSLVSQDRFSLYYLQPYVKATVGDTVEEVTSSQTLFNRIVCRSDTVVVNIGYGAYRGNRSCGSGPLISTDGAKTFQWAAYNLPVMGYFAAAIGPDDILLGCQGGAYSWTIKSVDANSPTVPSNLIGTAISSTQINLSWNASADDVAVTGYEVYRGNTLIGVTVNAKYSDTGLVASTSYTYSVSAYDAAGNTSAQTGPIQIITPASGSSSSSSGISSSSSSGSSSGSAPAGSASGGGGGGMSFVFFAALSTLALARFRTMHGNN